jgi:asparagine synthase (glutamine-hydrolysing)
VCGIYGMVALDGSGLRRPEAGERMAGALEHRGPDGRGCVSAADALIGVTRLRVMDLDPRADQPFTSPSGDLVLACNGEIYNAAELRGRYATHPFRSRSDVEVILPLFEARGSAGIADLVGMFGLALFDRRSRTLRLARDRAGEKPLFVARVGAEVWFASEIGALLASGAVSRALDRSAVAELLALGYIREPRTPFAAIRKVPAGSILTFQDGQEHVVRYWEPFAALPAAPAIADLRTLLRAAVARQVQADVPVGVFTSGGLDSSLLTVLAAEALGRHCVRSFCVGFPDRAFDERPWAARLATTLGIPHAAVEVRDEGVPEALDALASTGEPIVDPAAIPTWLLARAARAEVTVVLSGEGGDELFGGYPTYVGHRLVEYWTRMPPLMRSGLATLAGRLPRAAGGAPLEFLLKQFVAGAELPWPARHRAWSGSGVPLGALTVRPVDPAPDLPPPTDVVAAAMRLDYESSLRERLLVKIDRATMLASLEARAPFLDPALTRAAFAAGGAHVRGLATKRLLRQVATPLVPRFILRRRKRGLSVPVGRWLNGPLADVADRLLARDRLSAVGLVDGARVERLLREHRAGRANHGRALWTLFVTQHWLAHWNLEAA